MKNRISLLIIAVGLAMAVAVQSASASLLSSVLVPLQLNTLKDNSVAIVTTSTGGTIGTSDPLAVGDNIIGVIGIDQRISPLPQISVPPVLDVVYAVTITGTAAASGGYINFTLGSSPGLLQSLLPSFSSSMSSGDVFAVIASKGVTATDPTGQTPTTAFSLLNTTSGSEARVFNASGALVGANSDYLHAKLLDLNGDGKITLADYAGLNPLTTIGQEAGGLTVTHPGDIGPLGLVGVSDLNTFGGGSSLHQIYLNTSSLDTPGSGEASNGWQFSDQSYMSLEPVPEPVSIIVWGLLIPAAGVWFGFRKR